MIVKQPTHVLEKFTRCAKVCGLPFLDCAFQTLIGRAGHPLLSSPRSQFLRLCSISQSRSLYLLLSPPRSQVSELLAVPLHSVTPLFVQLQCYAFKRCETSCTKLCIV